MSAKGFTLVELIVAISIVSVLSTIGLVIYTQSHQSARDSKRKTDILEIQKALEQYYAINKAYPANLSGAGSYFQSGSTPVPPSGNYNYYYKVPDSTTCSEEKYILCTPLLEKPGNTATRSTLPSNSCTENAGTPGANNTYFCVGSLSN